MRQDDLREDIAAAAQAMTVRAGGGREIKKLVEYLLPGERVERMTTGSLGKGIGLVVMTDRRLLLVFDGRMNQSSKDYPYDKLSSVSWSSGMLSGTITMSTGMLSRVQITAVNKVDGRTLVDALRDRLGTGATQTTPPAAAAAPGAGFLDVADQLTKLAALRDSGVLTEDEFAAQKARILGTGL
jgi:hypothetical protein